MKAQTIISSILACTLSSVCPVYAQQDSVFVENSGELDAKNYTVTLKNIKLKDAGQNFILNVRRPNGENSTGISLAITSDSITAGNGISKVVLARYLTDGLDSHDYAICRNNNLNLEIYRDNILIGKIMEGYQNNIPGVIFYPSALNEGYDISILPAECRKPDEKAAESHIDQMISDTYTNMISDPYFNKGFTFDGQDTESRDGFYTNQAIYGGWGSEACLDTENAYSGKYCVRLEGQALQGTSGASLQVDLKLTKNTPYLVRAMVKSDGYEGKIGFDKNPDCILISDTYNEWKQIEGIVTPTADATCLYINNADFDNDGILWIDNLEVYEGYASTSDVKSNQTAVPFVQMKAAETWSPRRETSVYILGFTDDGETCSTINTDMVKEQGGRMLCKTVKGSALYPVHFSGDLAAVKVNGYYDGFSHTYENLVHGLDYVLMRYDYPQFHYLETGSPVPAGNYLIQFVDNLDGQNVMMYFNKTQEQQPSSDKYRLVGNPHATNFTPDGQFLRFDEDSQRFLLTKNESLRPFEAYIATDESMPVDVIVPNPVVTCIKGTYAENGSRISVRNTAGGIVIYAQNECMVTIYSMDGKIVTMADRHEGENTIGLKKGLYIVGKQKIAVF